MSKEQFVQKSQKVHGQYSYNKVVYTNTKNKVIITCPKHGDFEQRASNHIGGQGCPCCANDSRSKKILKTKMETRRIGLLYKTKK